MNSKKEITESRKAKDILKKQKTEKDYENVNGGNDYFDVYGNNWKIYINRETGDFLEKPTRK